MGGGSSTLWPFGPSREHLHGQAAVARESVEELLRRERLLQLRNGKFQRDVQIATQIATTRDILHFLGAFYVALGALQVAKVRFLRTGPLRLSQLPFIALPFQVAFLSDWAYGNKIERLHREVHEIIRNEAWWFNEAMPLPPFLEPTYRDLQAEVNAKLATQGRPPEREWATFGEGRKEEEIHAMSFPLTKALQESQWIRWAHANPRDVPDTVTPVDEEVVLLAARQGPTFYEGDAKKR